MERDKVFVEPAGARLELARAPREGHAATPNAPSCARGADAIGSSERLRPASSIYDGRFASIC
jgi:hypothetical protein